MSLKESQAALEAAPGAAVEAEPHNQPIGVLKCNFDSRSDGLTKGFLGVGSHFSDPYKLKAIDSPRRRESRDPVSASGNKVESPHAVA